MDKEFLAKQAKWLKEITSKVHNSMHDLAKHALFSVFAEGKEPHDALVTYLSHKALWEKLDVWDDLCLQAREKQFYGNYEDKDIEKMKKLLSFVSGGEEQSLPVDLDELKKAAEMQSEYATIQLNKFERVHCDALFFVMEHLYRVVIWESDRITLNESELTLWSERYAQFCCRVGRADTHLDLRLYALREAGTSMLKLANRFPDKPLFWIWYARSQHLLCRVVENRDARLQIAVNCLNNLTAAKDLPDVRIMRAVMLRHKAVLLAHTTDQLAQRIRPPPSAESLEVWKSAEQLFKETKGELLNADLHYKINLYHWASAPGTPKDYFNNALDTAVTLVHDIPFFDATTIYPLWDEWWRELNSDFFNIFKTAAYRLKTAQELYELLEKLPEIALIVKPRDQGEAVSKRKHDDSMMEEACEKEQLHKKAKLADAATTEISSI